MRKMISTKKAKVLDNFAVNDNGTIIEIGGNVAFESIEQIGHIVEAPANIQITATEGTPEVGIYLSGITSASFTSSWTNDSGAPYENDFEMNCLSFVEGIGWGIRFLEQGISTLYTAQQYNNLSVADVKGDVQVVKTSPLVKLNVGDKEFKPFFTEEQYQEILDLIA